MGVGARVRSWSPSHGHTPLMRAPSCDEVVALLGLFAWGLASHANKHDGHLDPASVDCLHAPQHSGPTPAPNYNSATRGHSQHMSAAVRCVGKAAAAHAHSLSAVQASITSALTIVAPARKGGCVCARGGTMGRAGLPCHGGCGLPSTTLVQTGKGPSGFVVKLIPAGKIRSKR